LLVARVPGGRLSRRATECLFFGLVIAAHAAARRYILYLVCAACLTPRPHFSHLETVPCDPKTLSACRIIDGRSALTEANGTKQERAGGTGYDYGRYMALEAVMGIVLCVSRIDQEILAYVASMKVRSDNDMTGKRREKILRDLHSVPPAARYAIIKKRIDRPDVNASLQKIRKVRNNLAHNVNVISRNGASGNYEPPVFYSIQDLNDVLCVANECFATLITIFEKHPKYTNWTKNRAHN